MTLILSCATPEYVVQVADRRLTYPDGKLYDDNSNKTVVLCQHIAFSYTGLAFLGNQRTDYWLAETLFGQRGKKHRDICLGVAEEASKRFRSIHRKNVDKRHAFVGIGWTRLAPNQSLTPILITISNAQDDNGNWLPEAENTFTLRTQFLQKPDSFLFEDTGQKLGTKPKADIKRLLRTSIAKNRGALGVAYILAVSVRQISMSNPFVGKSLLLISIPKQAVPERRKKLTDDLPELIFLHQPPNKDSFAYLYVPADADEGTHYSPHLACGSLIIDAKGGGS